mmetsp:Transcript_12201/g.18429  ORF Transcript_12201/g.18429 Transcript_12201/m.18429 type:complete len:355 (+) Transcript_12201:111-1175(+)
MGCYYSEPDDDFYIKHYEYHHLQTLFAYIGLHEQHIKLLHNFYSKGLTTVNSLLHLLGYPPNQYMNRAFNILSSDSHVTHICFKDFVLLIWNICTLDTHIAPFLFDLYDLDKNGSLDRSEATIMIMEIYGPEKYVNKDTQKLMDTMYKLTNKLVHMNIFWEYVSSNPKVLGPAASIPRDIRKRVLGEKIWDELTEHRMNTLCRSKYFALADIISFAPDYESSDSDGKPKVVGPGHRLRTPATMRRYSITSSVDSPTTDSKKMNDNQARTPSSAGDSMHMRFRRSSRGSVGSDHSTPTPGSRRNSGSKSGREDVPPLRRRSIGSSESGSGGLSTNAKLSVKRHHRSHSRKTFPIE